jgi:hypothetical protein
LPGTPPKKKVNAYAGYTDYRDSSSNDSCLGCGGEPGRCKDLAAGEPKEKEGVVEVFKVSTAPFLHFPTCGRQGFFSYFSIGGESAYVFCLNA